MRIDVYSTNTCPPCFALKNWLTAHDIPFTNHNVTEDKKALEYLMAHYGQVVPVIEIDGTAVIGFNRPRIEKLILESK